MTNDPDIPPNLIRATENLTEEIKKLDTLFPKATALRDELKRLTELGMVSRRMIYGLFGVAAIMLAVIGLLVVLFVRQNSNLTRIEDLSEVQRGGLCPLYSRIIQTDTPENQEIARKQGQNMEERAFYIRVIKKNYVDLRCFELEQR